MRLSFYGSLLLFPLLASCGPSSEEVRAREIVEPAVVGIFQRLPHPTITPMHSDFALGGTYHAQDAYLRALYWTSMPGKEVCDAFLQVVTQELGFEIYSGHECDPRPNRDRVNHGFGGQKSSGSKSVHTWIGISATEEPVRDKRITRIEINLTQTLDVRKWRECVPDDAGRVKQVCYSIWNHPLMELANSNSSGLERALIFRPRGQGN